MSKRHFSMNKWRNAPEFRGVLEDVLQLVLQNILYAVCHRGHPEAGRNKLEVRTDRAR